MMISTGLHCIKRLWNIYSRHILQLFSPWRPYQASTLQHIHQMSEMNLTWKQRWGLEWLSCSPRNHQERCSRNFPGAEKKPLLWFSTSHCPWFPRNFFHVHMKLHRDCFFNSWPPGARLSWWCRSANRAEEKPILSKRFLRSKLLLSLVIHMNDYDSSESSEMGSLNWKRPEVLIWWERWESWEPSIVQHSHIWGSGIRIIFTIMMMIRSWSCSS